MILTLIVALLLMVPPVVALAASGSCSYDAVAIQPLVAQLRVPADQVCQKVLDQRIAQQARADQARKLVALRRACFSGDQAACSALDTAAKAAPAPPSRAPRTR